MLVLLEQRHVSHDVNRLPRHAHFEQPRFDLFAQVAAGPSVKNNVPVGRHPYAVLAS
jgi:hypothetical protein